MKSDKTRSEAAIKDPEVKGSTIAVALAAAAERMVPLAGADLSQLSTHQEQAQAPSESALRTTNQADAKGIAPVNLDQLLAIVEDLSAFTTTEQLENRLSHCQIAYDQLKGASGRSEPQQTEMLLGAIARIQNKITAIKFSERREAQRALKAAASIPRERLTGKGAKVHA